jgi:iron(III) transport system substrate-binding protein
MKKRIIAALLAVSLAFSCLAVGAAADGNNTNTEKILVYLSGPEAMLTALEEGFEEDRGDVADFLIMSCGEVRSKVWTEKEAGEIQADVVWGSDPLIYNLLDAEGLLCDLSGIENAAAIGEEFATDHNYLLVNERYVAIIYNSDVLVGDGVPKSYDDLLDEKYAGGMVMADATQSSTALGIASCLYQLKGSEYLEGLKANGMLLTKSNGQVPSLILEGQYDLGVAPHDAVIRLQNKAKKEGYEIALKIAWPSEGAVAIRRPVAVIKNDGRSEEKQALAEELVNYLLSKKAQTITVKNGFVSVRSDMENSFLPEGVEKVGIDWEEASETQDELKTLYEQIFQD